MSKKWKTITWVLLGILAIFFSCLILISLICDSFVPDWRFSVADGIQILVVIAAVLLPMYIERWKREEYGPKPKVLVGNDHPFIREKQMVYGVVTINDIPSQSKFDSFKNVHIGVRNDGKEVLLSCEVKIEKIERKNPESEKWELYTPFLPFNLCWEIDGGKEVKSRHIDIKPDEIEFAVLGFYKSQNATEPLETRYEKMCTNSPETYFWYVKGSEPFNFVERFVPPYEPKMLGAGEYRIRFAVFGNNITKNFFDVYLNWDGLIKENIDNGFDYSPCVTLKKK
jgi:hypothetical protein